MKKHMSALFGYDKLPMEFRSRKQWNCHSSLPEMEPAPVKGIRHAWRRSSRLRRQLSRSIWVLFLSAPIRIPLPVWSLTCRMVIPYNDLAVRHFWKTPTLPVLGREPIQEAGVNVPLRRSCCRQPAKRKCAARANVLFIGDEIQTGLARTEKCSVVISKKMSSDIFWFLVRLSAVYYAGKSCAGRRRIMLTIHPGERFRAWIAGNPWLVRRSPLQYGGAGKWAPRRQCRKDGRLARSELRRHWTVIISSWCVEKGLLSAVVVDGSAAKRLKRWFVMAAEGRNGPAGQKPAHRR